MTSPLLANLNPEQLAAVTLPHASALILAGAGSGKTRVLTTRIAWLLATGQASPLSILAVTFTNKAAKEMLTRLSAMTPINTRGMWIGTFHGLCNRMLRAHYRDASLPQLFQIMDTQDQLALIKRLDKAHGIDDERFPPRQLQQFIPTRRKRACARTRSRRATNSRAGWSSTTRSTRRCASARAWSISPSSCCEATSCWRGHDGIREHYRRRFSHLLVDEFQDTNVLQYKWLQAARGAATRRSSPSATTTSRSTRSAAPTSPTCSTSSAISGRPECRSR